MRNIRRPSLTIIAHFASRRVATAPVTDVPGRPSLVAMTMVELYRRNALPQRNDARASGRRGVALCLSIGQTHVSVCVCAGMPCLRRRSQKRKKD